MNILLIRLSSFGDVVFTMPLAKALHASAPRVRLVWAVEAPLAPLLAGAPWVDGVLGATTRRWRREPLSSRTRSEFAAFARGVRAFAPDLVVDAHGLAKSAWATWLAPAGRKVGFGFGSAPESLSALTLDERVRAPREAHVVDRGLALAAHVTGERGFDRTPDVAHLVAAPDPAVESWLAARGGRPFVLVSPFSSRREKEWAGTGLVALATRLAARPLDAVLRFGPGEEERAAALVAASAGALLLGPPAGPAGTARLASAAEAVLGVDSGPTHLAAATSAPTLALFGPTDPARFGPVGPRVAIRRAPPPYNRVEGLAALSADAVHDDLVSLLGLP